jgi:uncharacterized membrane protein YhaH (DUF805 family)
MNTIFRIYFQFSGRIPRSTYWLASIPVAVVAFIADLCDEHSWSILLWLAIIWPSLAIATKRWHDRDKSGWWNLINLVPLVGPFWSLIECGFLPGTDGQNRFGQPNTALEPTPTAP